MSRITDNNNAVGTLPGKPSNSWRKMRRGNKTPNWNSDECFRSMEKVLTTRFISMPTNSVYWSVMSGQPFLYGCEGWTISNTMRTRLEATELWFLMRISWTDKLTNDAVLLKADTQRSLLKVITSRQIRFLGHVLRKNELEAIALTGKIEGKRARGRQRKMFLDWVETDGQESRFWSCARDERSTSWSPTSDSDMALQQDRTLSDPWVVILRYSEIIP